MLRPRSLCCQSSPRASLVVRRPQKHFHSSFSGNEAGQTLHALRRRCGQTYHVQLSKTFQSQNRAALHQKTLLAPMMQVPLAPKQTALQPLPRHRVPMSRRNWHNEASLLYQAELQEPRRQHDNGGIRGARNRSLDLRNT